jgi:hypothetical protein
VKRFWDDVTIETAADGFAVLLDGKPLRLPGGGLLCIRGEPLARAVAANPETYEFLEAEGYKYTIRLPINSVLQERIAWLLKRPASRPPHEVRRYYASFRYQAGSWTKPRRVVAKVEWHPGELYPRVGCIVTNMTRPAERVVMFYNHRGTAEQHIKDGKNAVTWTRLESAQNFVYQAGSLSWKRMEN